ncbi:hypothetical protein [Rhizobium chutanense]|uniref:Uncharacterized protein n=1 Tax=Rhizobium chutanense TaxID=2035448 RepID=A0A432NMH1_9HYPH|nr:hypothetical protein [Rhizobium chutanense]RUM00655.1 hypothetical protein EFR84_24190 [Rhizobium chutanense]
MNSSEQTIWKSFCTALGAEYREHKEIQGSSGLIHPVQAIAVDEVKKRLIVVSAEYNPRIAALMRVDIQATLPDTKVLVARPIAVDLAHTARMLFSDGGGGIDYTKVIKIAQTLGKGKGNGKGDKDLLEKQFGPQLTPIFDGIKRSGLPIRSHILHTLEQASSIDWSQLKFSQHTEALGLMLQGIQLVQGLDNLAEDRQQGICPIPTYEFSDHDWEVFLRGKEIDEIQERLKALNIFQYFFPPKDSFALAMVDNGKGNLPDIAAAAQLAEAGGHELSKNEIVPDVSKLPDILEALKDLGYIAEGEMSWEMTESGENARRSVRFRPRESLMAKLIGQFSAKLNMDLKDLFK